MIDAPPPLHPWPIGVGPRYQPSAHNVAVDAGRPIGRLTCESGGRRFAVHLELFANRKVVVVPPHIGINRHGCSYPLRTTTPTGVVEMRRDARYTLGDLFRVWGRRLRPGGLLSFDGTVSVFVAGRRVHGDPRAVTLTRHAQIVVEVGGYVAPHVRYLFPKGA